MSIDSADEPLNAPLAQAYAAPDMELEATRLMRATKHGDAAAFDRLVEALRPRAWKVAHGLVGSRDDALDLSQDAFLKVYRARDTYREDEPFLPWFHRILRNTCFSFLRQQGRLRPLVRAADEQGESAEFEIADDSSPPLDRAAGAELARDFWKAFRTLSSRDREILALRHFQSCSYREIALSLGVPEGTVMSRLFHARRRLRQKLSTHLYEIDPPGRNPRGKP